MLPRWPSRPKPVMSVAACAPAAFIASAPCRFSVVIEAMAAASTLSGAALRLTAVVSTPVPIGLVSTSASPGRAPAFDTMRRGSIVPVTNRPNFGSSSTIEWPPEMAMPASAQIAAAPSSTRRSGAVPSRSTGQATKESALSGVAPIA